MNRKRNSALLLALTVFLVLSLTGCSSPQKQEVQFNTDESQLEYAGFEVKFNQNVNLGDQRVVFQKVIFDRDSMTFAYKGSEILSPETIVVQGEEREPAGVQHIMEKPLGATLPSNDYHTITVQHNLKLIPQHISINTNVNGIKNTFYLDFPGDKIASSTTEEMVDANGNHVESDTNANAKLVVGIQSTVLEGNCQFIILDRISKKVLQRSFSFSSGSASFYVFGPIQQPRNNIKVKIIPGEQIVLISYVQPPAGASY